MKTAKSATITFTPLDAIIDAEVEAAIRPFVGKLKAAAEEDIKLEKHRDEASPDIAAEIFDATYSAAVAGDTAAEAKIYNMRPKARLVERQQQIWNVREATRVNGALKNIDLFNSAAEAALPAVRRAAEKAQAQHRSILRTIGENECDSPSIGNTIGWRVSNLTGLGDNCRHGDGARGLLDRGGFTRIVLGEAA